MAAPEGNQNAVGHRGTSLNDKKLAAEVRKLALDKIKVILLRPSVEMSPSEYEFHNQILLRLANNLLPRLAEITGEDGGAIIIDNATQNAVNDALMKFIDPSKASPAKPTTTPNGSSGNIAAPVVQPAAASPAPVSVPPAGA